MRAKVLNKTKETVTYVIVGLDIPPTTEKWEEFNKVMNSTSNPFIYESKPEIDKEAKEKIEMLTSILPFMLSSRVSMERGETADMTSTLMLGDISMKYCEKFHCSPMQFIQDYRTFEKMTLENMMDHGIGVGKVHRDFHNIKGKDNRRTRNNERPTREVDSEKCSIGDMIKAKGERK